MKAMWGRIRECASCIDENAAICAIYNPMFSHTPIYMALLLSTVLTACAGLDTRLPEINAVDLETEKQRQELEALNQFESDAGVLLNVGWPVLTENDGLCPKTRPSIGVKTHTLKSYSKPLRKTASRLFGADDTPRIFHIADGSPAALAGLKRGDIIINDAGEPAKLSGKTWETDLADNNVSVLRGENRLELSVKAVSACDYNLRLSQSSAINAYADGRNITVTAGMMKFTQSDSELALIIGHELAHNTMGHVPKSIINYVITLGGTRFTRPFESEADYVGLYYLVRAGYSSEGVEKFWQRLATVAPKSINRAKTHPTFPERYLGIQAARAEITAKQKGNEALLPNFKSGSAQSNK